MTTSEAIRQVLEKRFAGVSTSLGGVTKWQSFEGRMEELVADLAAIYPPPKSREALEKILRRQGHVRMGWIDNHLRVVIEEIMAWASDQRMARTWCDCIRWDSQSGHWVYLTTLHSADLWHFCPNCGAQRPVEA